MRFSVGNIVLIFLIAGYIPYIQTRHGCWYLVSRVYWIYFWPRNGDVQNCGSVRRCI